MSRKPEAVFRDSVHRYLVKDQPHRQPMGHMMHAGTPDFYYDGENSDLWVEYKFWPKVPARGFCLTDQKKKTKLSPLQTAWINRRYQNNTKHGGNVAVIVGCPEGGVILKEQNWEAFFTHDEFMSRIYSRKEIAEWITNYCRNSPYQR